ncbi:hypothetical protein DPMN_087147 [Dreissena polymorpha]|uniref:Uncharacterized protein n=1 Tax=Dreissena polymorpha TaxID=45954 RepID=A0A9D4KS54_DREPO|nr:hypothetical protein DPMN_087147 [Dreissena polymorpha]
MYNVDESGFSLAVKTGHVLGVRGAKSVYSVSASDKSQITVLAGMSAAAHFLRLMIVFPGQRFTRNMLEGFDDAMDGIGIKTADTTKEKRKEKEEAKKIREKEKLRKKKEKEENKAAAAKMKKGKSKKRKYDSLSSDEDSDSDINTSKLVQEDKSDGFEEEFEMCPACNRGYQHPYR